LFTFSHIMASVGDALISKVLGHSAAEKAFRPWWDNLEDYLIYGLVMLGLIVLPTAIINGTPLDCTLCQPGICPLDKIKNDTTDPGFNAWWVKKYCTFTAVDDFLLYFPYFLITIALFIVLIERGFIMAFKAGLKLDAFYNLLVSESLLESTVETTSSSEQKKSKFLEIEDSKLAFEVAQSFSQSSNYFVSYLVRTISELLVATGLFVWLLISGIPTIQDEESIYCPISEFYYHCSGHPQRFYFYVLLTTMFILAVYIFCCSYNIAWLFFPCFGSLSSLMKKYRTQFKKARSDTRISDRELLGDLYDVYYNSRDLKLLLDLLAASSGIAPCLRILCLFDKNMRKMVEVSNLKVEHYYNEEKKRTDAIVTFEDPEAVKDFFSSMKDVTCTFSVEISPCIKHVSSFVLIYFLVISFFFYFSGIYSLLEI